MTTRKKEINVPVKAIGCGQGGSNLIVAGKNIGMFEAVASINTTTADDMGIESAYQILCLNEDNPKRGAGKDARKGAQLYMDHLKEVKERLAMIFNRGSQDPFYVISASLGGGSGNGISNLLAKTLRQGMSPEAQQPVLGFMTLPEDSFVEQKAARNVLIALEEARTNRIYDSLFLVDNNKVYDKVREGNKLSSVNEKLWEPLAHTLSYVGKKSTATMDVEDFEALMKIGRCAAIYEIQIGKDLDSIDALREMVLSSWADDNHFYSNDHSHPHRLLKDDYTHGFGLIIAAPNSILERKRSIFEGFYSDMTQILGNPLSYRGFVSDESLKDNFNSIRVITIFTGLPFPLSRIGEIAEHAKQASKEIIDDTPSFLEGIDRNVLLGKQKVQKSNPESFSMFDILNDESPEEEPELGIDSAFLNTPATKTKKRKGINFG